MLARELRFNFRNKLPRNSLSFPSFNLRYGANDLGKIQVAVVVSKRIDNRATVRNKLKRKLLAEIEKQAENEFSFDLVFYIKKSMVESKDLDKEVASAISKITHETKVSG